MLMATISMALAIESTRMPLTKKRRLRSSPSPNRGRAVLAGSAAFDYKAELRIGNQTFRAIIDTGSADFAVAASSSLGCGTYYSSVCSDTVVSEKYGMGSWTGNLCSGPAVSLAGVSAGCAPFAGVRQDNHFFQCNSEGLNPGADAIIGMGFNTLLSPNAPSLLDALYAHSNMQRVFSLQFCGYGGGTTTGTGNLVLGGVDSSMHSGNFTFTPITQQAWYCVEMQSVGVSGEPMIALDNDQTCGTIVDSGTSMLQLASPAFSHVMSRLPSRAANPSACFTVSEVAVLPDIQIELGGGVSLSVPATTYTQPVPGRPDCRTVYVREAPTGKNSPPNILGQAVLEAYYTVFDQENLRVGFAPVAGCGGNPPGGTITGLPDCDQPGSNCGHPASSRSGLRRYFESGWGVLAIATAAVFVVVCLHHLFTKLSARPTALRLVVQTARRTELSRPFSPSTVTAVPVISNPTLPAVTALDPAWQQIHDPATGRDYFINSATGRATWTPPS